MARKPSQHSKTSVLGEEAILLLYCTTHAHTHAHTHTLSLSLARRPGCATNADLGLPEPVTCSDVSRRAFGRAPGWEGEGRDGQEL